MKTKTMVCWILASCLAAACGGGLAGNDDDALYELAGRWYDRGYNFTFEITQNGEGYIAKSRTRCTVSVSGSFVYFRDSRSSMVGSFSYSIKNGKLTMTLGTGDFSGMASSSPFIKSGSIPSGGSIPAELIGEWYSAHNTTIVPNFKITASGRMTISGSTTSYTAIVQGNNISVLQGSVLEGKFQYSFMYGEMIVTNGTKICEGLVVLSPFKKR